MTRSNRNLSTAVTLLLAAMTAVGCGGAEQRAVKERAKSGESAAGATTAEGPTQVLTAGDSTGGAAAAPETAPPRHAVFSLVDNRLLAHVERRGGLFVPAGSAAFAKYLRFARPSQPFSLREEEGGRRVARLAKKGTLELPLTAAQAAAADGLWLAVHSPNARKLGVDIGGKAAGKAALAPGWQLVHLPIEPGRLVAGENQLRLDPGGGKPIAIDWIQLGGAAPAAAAAGGDPGPAQAPWEAGALHFRAGDTLVWHLHVPDGGARLELDLPAGCSLAAHVAAHDGEPLAGSLAGAGAVLDLAPLAGRVARLSLTAAAGACDDARLTRAAITLPGAAPTRRAGPPPKHVVFWVMDTFRYDRAALWFDGAIAETPFMKRLADDGALFRVYYPGGNESTVSHVSMFTSLMPAVHRVVPRDGFSFKMEKSVAPLGRLARDAGMYVAGVTANGHVTMGAGYGRGFNVYENPMQAGKHDKDYGYAGERVLGRVLELAEAERAKQAGASLFLFVGTIDTHVPYRAYEPWVSKYDAHNPQPYKGKFLKSATAGGINVQGMLSRKPPAPRDEARLVANYASSISYQDSVVGMLLERLEQWGALEQTMIIITGDHGEEFWEHGIAGHGGSLREVVIHTPFLVYYPPLVPQTVVEEGAEGIDILPTVADAMGWTLPEAAQGESLIPLTQGVGRGYPRPSVSSHWEAAWTMRLGGWKLIVENDGDSRLYHIAADPSERTEITDRPLERRFVADAFSLLRVFQIEWRKSKHGVASNMSAEAAALLGE